ncbi:glycosyltransferase [bacterium]|nr:glycosyltransferase [bacterium]
MNYIFWASIALLGYHIVFYPLLVSFLSIFKRDRKTEEILEFPRITVLCPAFNEEEVLAKKLDSFVNLDYPKDKIDLIVISDDSEDRTNEIALEYVSKYDNISLRIQKPRKGKPSGHNMVEPDLNCDYVLSTDANSIFYPDSVKFLVRTILSDKRIGLVTGQLKYITKSGHSSGEGAYWKYENFIKKCESKLRSIIVANGSIFLIKRDLFTQINPISADDFERTLITLKEKHIAKYEPRALVEEEVSEESKEEFRRKIRIIAGEWDAVRRHKVLFNPFTNFYTFFTLGSHKILRWIFFAFVFLLIVSNVILALSMNKLYLIILVLQIVFYLIGSLDFIIKNGNSLKKITKLPGYFMIMILSSLLAFIRFVSGKQQATWSTIRTNQ